MKSGQLPFGACIVKDGRNVSEAHNTIYKETNIIAHAETNAIRDACENLNTLDLSGCTIYCTCEPCMMCYGAISLARIECIVYGAEKEHANIDGFSAPDISDEEMNRLTKGNIRIIKGFMKEECADLFRQWGERENKS